MPTLLLNNWKPILAACLLLLVFAAGWHAKAVSVEAGRARALEVEIAARREAEERADDIARSVEAERASIRRHEAELNRRWRTALAKPHPVCPLPDDVVGLLRDATMAERPAGQPDGPVRAVAPVPGRDLR